jgi:hypothetical protein
MINGILNEPSGRLALTVSARTVLSAPFEHVVNDVCGVDESGP